MKNFITIYEGNQPQNEENCNRNNSDFFLFFLFVNRFCHLQFKRNGFALLELEEEVRFNFEFKLKLVTGWPLITENIL